MCENHHNISVEISNSLTNVATIYQSVAEKFHPRSMAVYVGHVDLRNNNKEVAGITYDIHESLAHKVLLKICKETQHRWGNEITIHIGHTKGYIPAGGLCGVVVVTAKNFKLAGEICDYAMTEMIKRVSIWKLEHYVDGSEAWLPGKHTLKTAANKTQEVM